MAKNTLFLYQDPFIVHVQHISKEDYVFDYLHETERADEKKLHTILINFAITHSLVEQREGKLINSLSENRGSWQWVINWTNYRSLVDQSVFDRVLDTLSTDNLNPLTQIIDLHARLGTVFDHKLLNTFVNRTFKAISLIPYEVKDTSVVSWETVHRKAPFLWILILLQVVINLHVSKLT